jgi:uncharacterized membrane protein YsdA (DUF1294 family)
VKNNTRSHSNQAWLLKVNFFANTIADSDNKIEIRAEWKISKKERKRLKIGQIGQIGQIFDRDKSEHKGKEQNHTFMCVVVVCDDIYSSLLMR